MSHDRPYIPAGCDQQGRLPATPHQAAEACTDLGAAGARTRPVLWARLRIALLRWHLACVRDELRHYSALGWVGPVYLRESNAEQRRLMARIRRLQDASTAPRHPMPPGPRVLLTVVVAFVGAAGLALASCGGGGSAEEPQPRPPMDCAKTPEQCK